MDFVKYKKNIIKCLFFAVIILSFILIINTFKYNILVAHDLFMDTYGKPFLQPDHGRYIGSCILNLFTEDYI